MSVDFAIPPALQELQVRIREFIAREVIPLERDPRQGVHGPEPALCAELIGRARAAGLLSPHVASQYGGLGLSHFGRAIAFEEAGYSLLGPVALNVFAPDEGNMHLLEAVATSAQKDRWLAPLAAGDIRSCFCMTEPAPGAGSDPSMLKTQAVPDGDGYLITAPNGSRPAPTARSSRSSWPTCRAWAPPCSCRTWAHRASRSNATSPRWTPASPGGTAWCASTGCVRAPRTSSAKPASGMRRCGCLRRG